MSEEKGIEGDVCGLLVSCDLEFDAHEFVKRMLLYGFGIGVGIGLVFFNHSLSISFLMGAAAFLVFGVLVYSLLVVTSARRVAAIEEALPDFLSVMASHIRSGLTYDRALLLSARKEFGPLSKEVNKAAKETMTGKPFGEAMLDMAVKVRSETFMKTMKLIVEGFNSGGNLAQLLENTSLDMRRFSSTRREISATVLVYRLFMFAAACIGAPLLYAVATFLIKVITQTKAKMNINSLDAGQAGLPMLGGASSLSPESVFLFSLLAIAIGAFFSALAAGVISKGKESEGFAYVPLLLAVSIGAFLLITFLLDALMGGFFGRV